MDRFGLERVDTPQGNQQAASAGLHSSIVAGAAGITEYPMRLTRQLSSSILATTVLALGFAAAGPAAAAPCSDLDMVVATFTSHGASVYMIPGERLQVVAHDAEELTGAHYAGVTRGFLVLGKEELVIGLEIGGCLIDPIRVRVPPQYAAEVGTA